MNVALDVERARAETPGCGHVTHLNNAGAALPPQPVLDAVLGHLDLEARIGGYEAAEDRRDAIDATRSALARLLGCSPPEVAFAESATRAWNIAFSAFAFGPGDRVLTSRVEYGSNVLALLQAANRHGVRVEVIPSLPTGEVDADALGSLLDDRVRLVAVTHVPTQGGLVNPAAAIGRVTRAAGIPYLLDACQSAGQMPLAVADLGCDLLAGTGRKFLRGPRGTGFLYVRQSIIDQLEPSGIDIHSADWLDASTYRLRPDATRFELWEKSYANLLGLGAAVEYALGWGLDSIRDRVYALADRLRALLAAVPGVTVHDQGVERCAIVTFTLAGHDPEVLRRMLRVERINVSVSSAGSARLDLDARGLAALLRASVHYFNTEEELDALVAALPAPR